MRLSIADVELCLAKPLTQICADFTQIAADFFWFCCDLCDA